MINRPAEGGPARLARPLWSWSPRPIDCPSHQYVSWFGRPEDHPDGHSTVQSFCRFACYTFIIIDGKAYLALKLATYCDFFCLFKIAQGSLGGPHIIFSDS